MDEAIRVVIRFVHLLAGAAWVGGSIFYWAVLRPQMKVEGSAPPGSFLLGINRAFGEATRLSMGVLLLTGAIMTFDRLTNTMVNFYYILTLGLKVGAAGVMFFLAWTLWQRRAATPSVGSPNPGPPGTGSALEKISPPTVILTLGVLVFALGALLTRIYEAGLEGAYLALLESNSVP